MQHGIGSDRRFLLYERVLGEITLTPDAIRASSFSFRAHAVLRPDPPCCLCRCPRSRHPGLSARMPCPA
ncbi:MAG: hypothetical protein MZU97_27160 [Bacillus subtilis]|nr:hypothetical protein [Bacillus subtilis]